VRTKVGVWNGGFRPHQPFQPGVVVPAGRPELSGAHDLRAHARIVEPQERVVDATAATGLALPLVPPARREHPLVEPLPGVTEGFLEAQPFARAEAVERNREELNAGEGHRGSFRSGRHDDKTPPPRPPLER
jgi:hypothetical protein